MSAICGFGYLELKKEVFQHLSYHLSRDVAVVRQSLKSLGPDVFDYRSELLTRFELDRVRRTNDFGFLVLKQGILFYGNPVTDKLLTLPTGLHRIATDKESGAVFVQHTKTSISGVDVSLLAWIPALREELELDRMRVTFVLVALISSVLCALGVGVLVSRQFGTIDDLRKSIRKNRHALSLALVPVPTSGYESKQLAESYNSVIDELNGQIKDIQNFSEHCAHELRTPLAILRVEIEQSMLLQQQLKLQNQGQDDSGFDELYNSQSAQLELIDRLSVLINRLLNLSRAGSPNLGMQRLLPIIERATQEFSPLFEEAGWRVETAIDPSFEALVDSNAIHQVIVDLFDNCLRHGADRGLLQITASCLQHGTVLVFENTICPVGQGRKSTGHGLGKLIIERFMRTMGGSAEWFTVSGKMVVNVYLASGANESNAGKEA